MSEVDLLLAAIHAQQASIASLVASKEEDRQAMAALTSRVGDQGAHIGALVQCVAMLLEEEIGTPVADEHEPQVETDWDGNQIA